MTPRQRLERLLARRRARARARARMAETAAAVWAEQRARRAAAVVRGEGPGDDT